jgi:hypothetical protein
MSKVSETERREMRVGPKTEQRDPTYKSDSTVNDPEWRFKVDDRPEAMIDPDRTEAVVPREPMPEIDSKRA